MNTKVTLPTIEELMKKKERPVTVQTRLEPQMKQEAERLAKSLGVSLSALLKHSLRYYLALERSSREKG